ncbi:hypothetical protein Tco_1039155 [Tanacetum coccineum]
MSALRRSGRSSRIGRILKDGHGGTWFQLTHRFIATCSYPTDKHKDIMKAQVHISRLPLSDEALKSKNFKEVSVTLITEHFSQSGKVLKLKNFKKEASLKLSSYQIKKDVSMSV